jgi:predicted enzyme related to lactoylglutathione lyase
MAIKSIDLAWISTSDMAKAKKFFGEKLGLELTADTPEHNWLEFKGKDGGAGFGVGKDDPYSPIKSGQNAIVCFTVDDLVKTKQEFEKKGVKMIGDIVDIPGHVKMQLIADEDGNIFHLAQPLNGPTAR